MREPSIHIMKSDLVKLLGELLGYDEDQATGLASQLMFRAKPYSINTRTVSITNQRMEKKAEQMLQANRLDADLLARVIHLTRKKLRHRGISQIKPGEKNWNLIKEMTAHALDFCNEFNLKRETGFRKYVEVGLSKMKKFALPKFLNMYEGICETYIAMQEIEQDDDREMTEEMYRFYSQRVIEQTGIHDRLEELPDKYVWFVRARQEAEKMNVSVKVYMNAQFDGLDFTKGIPHPTQLVGAKSTERVIRYCYEHNIKIKR